MTPRCPWIRKWLAGRAPGVALLLGLLVTAVRTAAADLPSLWAERTRCVVAVEYVIETETERRPSTAYGVVVDAQGTIIIPGGAIDLQVAARQLRDFKVYLPGEPDPTPATYLGQDGLTNWHFLRVAASLWPHLVPLATFAAPDTSPVPALGEEVWGLGLRNKDEDFLPYLLTSHVALLQSLPQRTAIAQQEVASPGLPVFNHDGALLGLAVASFGQTFVLFSRATHDGAPIVLINAEESSAFLLAGEVLPSLSRIPQDVSGRPLPWLGAFGLEPMARDVARFLHLENQSGAVVSEILEGSPAEKAGLKSRDIILAIDGQPLPRFRPEHIVIVFVEREIERRRPGDPMRLTVLRGQERLDLAARLGDEPKLVREADRKYFDRLGLTVREAVYSDAVARRISPKDFVGVIADFVRPNSAMAIAGLRPEDWIKEIDGAEVTSFAQAVQKFSALESETLRTEIVLLVVHGTDTAVLHVKLR